MQPTQKNEDGNELQAAQKNGERSLCCGRPKKVELTWENGERSFYFGCTKKVGLDLGIDSQQRYASDDCHWIPSCHNDVDDGQIKEERKARDSWDEKP